MVYNSTRLLLSILCCLSWLCFKGVNSTAQFSIIISNPVINTATDISTYVYPNSGTAFLESSYQIHFPEYLGFLYTSTTPGLCYELPTQLATSNYISRLPTCVFSTASDGGIVLTVSNLRVTGTSAPTYYGLYFSGLTTGPSARSSQINGDSSTGTYATTYVGTSLKETIYANNYLFSYIDKTSGVTLTGDPSQNGVYGVLTITFNVDQEIPIAGSLSIGFPLQNSQYVGLGITPSQMMVDTSNLVVTGSYVTSSTTSLGTLTFTTKQESVLTYIKILLGNSAAIASGSVLTVEMEEIYMPPSLAPKDSFIVFSGDEEYYEIEHAEYMELTNTLPGDETTTSNLSTATMAGLTGVLEEDETYDFSVQLTGDIPMDGYFTLYIPTTVGMPSGGVSDLTLVCDQFCDEADVTLTYSSSTRLLTFSGVVPDVSSYIIAPGPIVFSITGFTNPSNTDNAYIIFTSYAVLSTGTYMIDQISSMYVAAEQGECDITEVYPTDGNYKIYGIASSWTFTMSCEHDISTLDGIRLTFPINAFYVIETNDCEMGEQSTESTCSTDNSDGTITVLLFMEADVDADDSFTFTIDSLRNPALLGVENTVQVEILSTTGGTIDVGTYTIDNDLFLKGEILVFKVTSQDTGVGQFPVFYDFEIQPSGEFYEDSYIVITMPDTVGIYREREIERMCFYDMDGFTNSRINCKVNGNVITIVQGFVYEATTVMTDTDTMVPPTITFSLPQFWNPRTMVASGAFGLSIYSDDDDEIYTWDPTYAITVNGVTSTAVTEGPCVQMSTPATPQSIVYSRESKQNGAITNYNMTIRTTNFLIEGDQIKVQLPNPVFFSETSKCLAMSTNLRLNQTYSINVDLTIMTISLLLPLQWRSLQAGSTAKISAGEEFTIQLTEIKNPITTTPTTGSIKYYTYTGGSLIEQQTAGLTITNTIPGQIEQPFTAMQPDDFRQSYSNNYTLTFRPVNYVQNMQIILTVPTEIKFGSNQIKCYGEQGTDSSSLACTTNIKLRTVTVTNAVAFQKGNPGTIKLKFETFVNPDKNIVTSTFTLTTKTSDNYMVDQMTTDLTINFFCEYPCLTCDSLINTQCQSCYPQNEFSIFYQSKCLVECPAGYTNQTEGFCTLCDHLCLTCKGTTDTCVTCIEGYMLHQDQCVEIVIWPFPFIAVGIIQFFIILISEIKTKTQSRFKEAFIALLSFPEMGSWITFLVFLNWRSGYSGSFLIASLAMGIYLFLNLVHACVHPTRMVPSSLQSYKTMSSQYPYSTQLLRLTSYLVSYKFSLILVSYLCMKPRFRGDYSLLNWRQFNRFSLAFILLPYPIMMFSCGYYLWQDGLFSYAGYVSVEVIVISTVTALLTFLDAIQALKCRVSSNLHSVEEVAQRLAASNQGDYESENSEQDGMKIRKRKRNQKQNQQDEFGDDNQQDNQQLRSQGNNQDFSTQKQLNMLEDLARQMKTEKEQLRLEKERIERERNLRFHDDQETQRPDQPQPQQRVQQIARELQTPTQLFQSESQQSDNESFTIVSPKNWRESTVDSVQQNKKVVKSYVDQPIRRQPNNNYFDQAEDSELNDSSRQLLLDNNQIILRQNYRNFEDEMENEERQVQSKLESEPSLLVVEDNFSEEIEVKECAEMPFPSQGLINYASEINQDNYDQRQFYRQLTTEISQSPEEVIEQKTESEIELANLLQYEEQQSEYSLQKETALYEEIESKMSLHDQTQEFNQESNQFRDKDLSEIKQQKSEDDFAQSSDDLKISELKIQQNAHFEVLDDHLSKIASEQIFLLQDDAERGETGIPMSQIFGSEINFNLSKVGSHQHFQESDDNQEALKEASDQVSQRSQHKSESPWEVVNDFESEKSLFEATKQQFHENQKIFEDSVDKEFLSEQRSPVNENEDNSKYFEIADKYIFSENLSSVDEDEKVDDKPVSEKTLSDQDENLTEKVVDEVFVSEKRLSEGDEDQEKVSVLMSDSYEEQKVAKKDSSELESDGFIEQKKVVNFMPDESIQQENKFQVFEDDTGNSESSEGIVDHKPFQSAVNLQSKDILKHQQRYNYQADDQIIERQTQSRNSSQLKAHTQQMIAPSVSKSLIVHKKPIIYSDKSESSIDEMMGDTPSNYNLANGRMDGKSLGLKAILLHLQKNDPKSLNTISELEERKVALDESLEGGWNNMSSPLKGNSRNVHVINDEPLADDTIINFQRHKKKAIKTNKTFAETPNPVQGNYSNRGPVGRSHAFASGTGDDLTQNQVRKNNYL